MTDRHVVNKSLKEQFEIARTELFTKYLDGFSDMTPEAQKAMSSVHGLFCGLHVIANMATAASKALLLFEEIAVPDDTIYHKLGI